VLQQRPYTFAQTNLSPSFFACDKAADHTFRFSSSSCFSLLASPLSIPPSVFCFHQFTLEHIQLTVPVSAIAPPSCPGRTAADRWVKAVNAEGSYGQWTYAMARETTEVVGILNRVLEGETVAAKSGS